MALDFPASPSTGTTYTGPNGVVWIWDGVKWTVGTQSGAYLPLSGGALTGNLSTGTGVGTGPASIEVGEGRSGDGVALIDLHAAVGTDFEFRLIRASGVNGVVAMQNGGTGALEITAGVGTGTVRTISLSGVTGDTTFPAKLGIGTVTPAASLSIALGGDDAVNYGGALQITRGGTDARFAAFIRSGAAVVTMGYKPGATGIFGFGGLAATEAAFDPGWFCWEINSGNATIGTSVLHADAKLFVNGNLRIAGGYGARAGTPGPDRSNVFNIDWVPGAQLWIDNVNLGTIAFTCDYRIKNNVAPLGSTWDQVKVLRPISYNYKACPELLREEDDPALRWGFLAHELQETLLPTAASGEKDAPNIVQSPDLVAICAALTKALQEAMARIEALEGGTP